MYFIQLRSLWTCLWAPGQYFNLPDRSHQLSQRDFKLNMIKTQLMIFPSETWSSVFHISVEGKVMHTQKSPLTCYFSSHPFLTPLRAEFTWPPRYLCSPFPIFFAILVQVTLLSHPNSCPLSSLRCTQSSLWDCVITDHPSHPVQWLSALLRICQVLSLPLQAWCGSASIAPLILAAVHSLPFTPTSPHQGPAPGQLDVQFALVKILLNSTPVYMWSVF